MEYFGQLHYITQWAEFCSYAYETWGFNLTGGLFVLQ